MGVKAMRATKIFERKDAKKRERLELERRAKKLEETDISNNFDTEMFVKRQELRSCIGNYNRAITELKKMGGY